MKNIARGAFTPGDVAYEDVPLGSGGSAVPFSRSTSRQCIACAHKAKLLPNIAEPASAPPVLIPTPIPDRTEPELTEILETVRITPPIRTMTAKSESGVREALEDRDPNNLNQHLQVPFCCLFGM